MECASISAALREDVQRPAAALTDPTLPLEYAARGQPGSIERSGCQFAAWAARPGCSGVPAASGLARRGHRVVKLSSTQPKQLPPWAQSAAPAPTICALASEVL